MDIKQFVKRNRITISSEVVGVNPNNPDWQDATHFRTVLKRARHQMTIYFSMGYAHTGEPTAEDVLCCLASDSAGVENARDFEDWFSDYGYNTDSRKAKHLYNACIKQAEKLKIFLGKTRYDQLLWEIEEK